MKTGTMKGKTDMKKTNDDAVLEKEFDFENAVRNPYAKKLKKQITIKLAPAVIDYFKDDQNMVLDD